MELNTSKYPQIMKIATGLPWAIMPDRMESIIEVLDLRINGMKFDRNEIEARIKKIEANDGGDFSIVGGTAIIPITGVIAPKMDMMVDISGGCSCDNVAKMVVNAQNNDAVDSILFDIDSPGGNVAGVPELFRHIMSFRGQKRMIAIANNLAASAAIFIASAADEIVVTPSGEVGSIGVLTVHTEFAEADKEAGIKHTIIKAGEFKAEANTVEPLTDAAKDHIQGQIDVFFNTFVLSVAEGRNVSVAKVKSDFGKGRTMLAEEALAAGLVDRIATRAEVLGQLESRRAATMQNRNNQAKLNRLRIK